MKDFMNNKMETEKPPRKRLACFNHKSKHRSFQIYLCVPFWRWQEVCLTFSKEFVSYLLIIAPSGARLMKMLTYFYCNPPNPCDFACRNINSSLCPAFFIGPAFRIQGKWYLWEEAGSLGQGPLWLLCAPRCPVFSLHVTLASLCYRHLHYPSRVLNSHLWGRLAHRKHQVTDFEDKGQSAPFSVTALVWPDAGLSHLSRHSHTCCSFPAVFWHQSSFDHWRQYVLN